MRNEGERVSLEDALSLADHASPAPAEAARALRRLRDHIQSQSAPPGYRLQPLVEYDAMCAAMQVDPAFGHSLHPDDAAVDAFAIALKTKLAAARAKGRSGWNTPDHTLQQVLSDMLRGHVEKGDPRDVANFCMFLHLRGETILPASAPVEPSNLVALDAGVATLKFTVPTADHS